jgi:selenocysteine lyase/cysteine desulfurase
MNKYQDILDKNLIYKSGYNESKIKIVYADYTASGLPSPIIEKYLEKNIYPYYSNTHSNASNGIYIKNKIATIKNSIRKNFNISNDYKIIFTGNGTTGAINHLVNTIDYTIYNKTYIYISSYEHYSNYLPWIELHNKNENIHVKIIPFDNNNELDIEWFDNNVKENCLENNTLIILSIINCSNVNGIFLPIEKFKNIFYKYKNNTITKYFFSDYACSAPYVKIDASNYDAIFFSPHKFIGGVSTPGILIAHKKIFTKQTPFCPGGGCVINATHDKIIYQTDIEKKETAGTPNIIGIFRIDQVILLKNKIYDIIENNEIILADIILNTVKLFENKYPNFKTILYDKTNNKKLPIISFVIKELHYNFIVVLFSDLFGIQTRGGNSCCGLLAEHIKNKYNYDGWCRITFHWSMNKKIIKYIITAWDYIIANGKSHLKDYTFNSSQNLFFKSNKIK